MAGHCGRPDLATAGVDALVKRVNLGCLVVDFQGRLGWFDHGFGLDIVFRTRLCNKWMEWAM